MAKTYSPKKVVLSIAGQAITGYAEGTFISVENEVDGFTKSVGADGEVARMASSNVSGTLTLTLMQTSDSNDLLSSLYTADRISLSGKFPIHCEDKNGTTLFSAQEAWVVKPATIEQGNELSDREWRIDCSILNIFVGGNNT